MGGTKTFDDRISMNTIRKVKKKNKGIMSFFNKMRSFPEYHNSYDAVIQNRETEQKMIESMSLAFGKEYDLFYKKQPEDLHAGLQSIMQGGQNQTKIMEELHSKVAFLPQDFHTYLDSFDEKRKKQEKTDSVEAAAKKAEEKAVATEKKLEQLRAKNSPEVAATEALSIENRDKATKAREEADKAKREFDEYCEEYKKSFANTFVTMMEGFFSLRQKSLKQLSVAGGEIESSVQQLHEFKDKSLERLREKAKSYEEIQI